MIAPIADVFFKIVIRPSQLNGGTMFTNTLMYHHLCTLFPQRLSETINLLSSSR